MQGCVFSVAVYVGCIGIFHTKFFLFAVSEPPSIRIPPADQIAIEGATVHLQCTTRGRDVSTRWYYNSQPIREQHNIRISGQ